MFDGNWVTGGCSAAWSTRGLLPSSSHTSPSLQVAALPPYHLPFSPSIILMVTYIYVMHKHYANIKARKAI